MVSYVQRSQCHEALVDVVAAVGGGGGGGGGRTGGGSDEGVAVGVVGRQRRKVQRVDDAPRAEYDVFARIFIIGEEWVGRHGVTDGEGRNVRTDVA